MGDVGDDAGSVPVAGSEDKDKDYDSVMDEIKRKREERRKQQEEEERREEEEKKKREEDRIARKREREMKQKEREDAFQKELEEKQKKDQKEEERKRKREEREKQRLEEEQKEKEEEERRLREKAERRKALEDQEAEEARKRGDFREESSKRRAEESTDAAADAAPREEEVRRTYIPAGKLVEHMLEVIGNHPTVGHKDTIDKLVGDDDMRDELLRQLNEEHPQFTEYFSTPEIVIHVIRHLSTIPPNAQKLPSHQVDNIVARMEFARDIIAGTMPHLWKKLLLPENYHVLDELFALLRSDLPVLPLFHVSCFSKSLEFLIYRRGFDVSTYMHSRKADIVPSIFKHLRDANVMDVVMKLVENENANAAYKEYNPKDAEIPSWCDDIVPNILTFLKKEDTPTTDEEIENLSILITQVFERFNSCKLAFQLREAAFATAVVKHAFSSSTVKHESTLMNLINFVTVILKALENTASYTTDLLPPLVSSMLSPLPKPDVITTATTTNSSETPAISITPVTTNNTTATASNATTTTSTETPIDLLSKWLRDGSPLQNPNAPVPKRFAKNASSFSIFRMKCLQCVNTLASLNYQCVDVALQASGMLSVCVDLFFLHEDNNIVHFCVEDIVKQLLVRELHNPEESGGKVTTHILSQCNLVERIIDGLSTTKALANAKGRFDAAKVAPPPFSGHILNICKLISYIAEKSFPTRSLIAECSGYRWGQVVLFRLGMKANSDNEWKEPMKKVDTKDQVAKASGPVVD